MMNKVTLRALEERIARLEAALTGPEVVPADDRCVHAIARATAYQMGLKLEDVLGASKEYRLARARFAIMWVTRKVHGYSLERIGRPLNRRDHTTVMSGLRKADHLRVTDPAFRMLTNGLLRQFEERQALNHSVRTVGLEQPCAQQ